MMRWMLALVLLCGCGKASNSAGSAKAGDPPPRKETATCATVVDHGLDVTRRDPQAAKILAGMKDKDLQDMKNGAVAECEKKWSEATRSCFMAAEDRAAMDACDEAQKAAEATTP